MDKIGPSFKNKTRVELKPYLFKSLEQLTYAWGRSVLALIDLQRTVTFVKYAFLNENLILALVIYTFLDSPVTLNPVAHIADGIKVLTVFKHCVSHVK